LQLLSQHLRRLHKQNIHCRKMHIYLISLWLHFYAVGFEILVLGPTVMALLRASNQSTRGSN
jgi:hypothetical protein